MFTVVATEQLHLDGIAEYEMFLRPFLNNSHIAFCRWKPNAESLEDAIPELNATVSRHEKWRLIVVCQEDGLFQKNPFDTVGFAKPERTADMDDLEYLQLVQKAKFAAYEQAAKQPLTKLMTWLCEAPMVTAGVNNAQEDPEFAAYLNEQAKKAELRQQIKGNYTPEITLPSEIICLATRTYCDDSYDIQNSWEMRLDSIYSRFWDWNLYFDRMRYLVFDILPKRHRNYIFDYIRFLYTLMLLAEHEMPQSCLNPNWVYTLISETDEVALRDLLGRYEAKLTVTEQMIAQKHKDLEKKETPQLTDQESQTMFCTNIPVPVTNASDFDCSTLYISADGVGLSGDCPKVELNAWNDDYLKSRRALGKYLKTPGRSLRKTTKLMRSLNRADVDRAVELNEYQLDDISDYVREEEMQMIATPTSDFTNVDRFNEALEDQNKQVNTVLERRMTRFWTIALGIVAAVCYAIGFIPMFFTNFETESGTFFSWIFFAVGAGILLLIAFVTLFFLKKPVKAGYSDYNGIMRDVENEVNGSLRQYSLYLSHACNVMRGYSVLNYCRENENPKLTKLRIYKKHMLDIQRVREELELVFGSFMPQSIPESAADETYTYDFERAVDFEYPFPYTPDRKARIDFMQKGNLIDTPVDFVKCLYVRREELYD